MISHPPYSRFWIRRQNENEKEAKNLDRERRTKQHANTVSRVCLFLFFLSSSSSCWCFLFYFLIATPLFSRIFTPPRSWPIVIVFVTSSSPSSSFCCVVFSPSLSTTPATCDHLFLVSLFFSFLSFFLSSIPPSSFDYYVMLLICYMQLSLDCR